jgi:hypothetical protein
MLENTLNDMNLNTSYTVTLDEDEDEGLLLPIPDEILDELGWEDGCVLEWDINEDDNTIIIRKVDEDGDV